MFISSGVLTCFKLLSFCLIFFMVGNERTFDVLRVTTVRSTSKNQILYKRILSTSRTESPDL